MTVHVYSQRTKEKRGNQGEWRPRQSTGSKGEGKQTRYWIDCCAAKKFNPGLRFIWPSPYGERGGSPGPATPDDDGHG